MKKYLIKLTAILIISFYLLPIQPARAHPADLYAHTITINLTQTDMRIEWHALPGFRICRYRNY